MKGKSGWIMGIGWAMLAVLLVGALPGEEKAQADAPCATVPKVTDAMALQNDSELGEVCQLAREILGEITTEDMTDMEVAFAIYRWTGSNIRYVGFSDKSSWTEAAYRAFTQRTGDCYNFFSAAKALFYVAGIENVDVVKSDTTYSTHYWSLINLGDGWYHVDCTPRRAGGNLFMNTDAELEAYSLENRNSHIFDENLYPVRAMKSVQNMIDYENGEIRS